MAQPNVVDLQPLSINIGGVIILPTMSVEIAPGLTNAALRHSGNRSPSSVLHSGGQESITVTMPVKDALDNFPFNQHVGYTDLLVTLATFDSDGNRNSGLNHDQWSSAQGVAMFSGFSVSPNAVIQATITITPLSANGQDSALADASSVALPVLAAEPVLHAMGPLVVNGTLVQGTSNWDFQQNNVSQVNVGFDGDRFPQSASHEGSNPQFTGSSTNVADLLAIATFGGATVTNTVDLYLYENDPTTNSFKTTGIKLAMTSCLFELGGTSMTQDSTTPQNFTISALTEDPIAPAVTYSPSVTIPTA